MGTATQIPAFFATVGDWKYYICIMTYAQVSNQVNFQYELDKNRDLGRLMQRGLSDRTEDIREYLLTNDHRFLGALVVAVWGGRPVYHELRMTTPDTRAPFLDDGIGLLTFDGSQSYFALDGQHRLRAIKDAVRANPELGPEQIAVLIVPHFDDEQGRLRTRRLFTNINRRAKTTTTAENIALDEDDGFAILTRQMLTEHPLLKRDGVVRVFTRPPEQEPAGRMRLAGDSMPRKADSWTSIVALYAMLRNVGFNLHSSMHSDRTRPSDDVLEESYRLLVTRIENLMDACGQVRKPMQERVPGWQLRFPQDDPSGGNPFMRPAVQKIVTKVAGMCFVKRVPWETILARLTALEWRLDKAPWTAVFNVDTSRMVVGSDNKKLLEELLKAHLIPESVRQIRDARKEYKALIGTEYPVSLEDMRSVLNGASAASGEAQ